MEETQRRRAAQIEYNTKHGITPRSVVKEIKDQLPVEHHENQMDNLDENVLQQLDVAAIPKDELKRMIKRLEEEMSRAAQELDFEYAAQLRDKVAEAKRGL